MHASILSLAYLLGSLTFILGLKMLSHPRTARKGNLIAAAGMLLAVIATLFFYRGEKGHGLQNLGLIFIALAIGTIVGVIAAKRVHMTAMPEMVSMFNGMGGLCAGLIAMIEFNHLLHIPVLSLPMGSEVLQVLHGTPITGGMMFILLLETLIGCVSFSGSMIAFAKLRGRLNHASFKGQHLVNLVVLLGMLALFILLMVQVPAVQSISLPSGNSLSYGQPMASGSAGLYIGLVVLAMLYGVLFVLPIGGADMPVVISLLNSCTGVAAACGGFLYSNAVMLTGGILVGSAGAILTVLMCKAMNRSLGNVLLGAFSSVVKSGSSAQVHGSIKEIGLSDAATVLAYARKVFIVPGYGLAVAQAQHACHELEKLLEDRGAEVSYAIHPVAGRMPGHMNVLLAEADVPYEKLMEMEVANQEFPSTDVVLILGANDVVNPAARKDPGSPIYGMPILEVDLAKSVIVNKRSMKPGYAGIENALFYEPRTSMLFGDAKQVLQQLIAEIKTL